MTELKTIPIDQLKPHPDNPRLRLRDDVVTQIAAEITRNGFGEEHALLVRPVNGHYQIISGHHRHGAARRVGLDSLPCWVREMDDDEAFMQLILSNTQGELSPLEEGHHAYHYIERGSGGRGKKEGLRDYARRLNKNPSTLSHLRSAYEVYEKCVHGTQYTQFSAKDTVYTHKHLYEISLSPKDCWPPLIAAMIASAKPWAVRDTAGKVAEIAKFNIPDRHASWLLRGQITDSYLRHEQPTPNTVQRLGEEADRVFDAIKAEKVATEHDATEFRAWLVANAGGDSWDHRKIGKYHADLIEEWSKRREQADDRIKIYNCRAAELLAEAGIEPGSVDLIFTDPPYKVEFVECWSELGEMAVALLKPGGLLVAYTGQYTMPDALDRLRAAGLSWFWCYAIAHNGAFFRMNATHVQCGWKPLLVMRNGVGDLPNWHKDFVTDGSREKSKTAGGDDFSGGEWQQSEAEAAYWISELSKPDNLVVDPFVGSGTTAAACKSQGRRFIGCDIDPRAIERAKERIA